MIRIRSAKPLPNYRLEIEFTDDTRGVADLAHLAGVGVFSAWNTPGCFDQVSVDPLTRTVSWPGGIDLDPDVLYSNITGKPLPGQSDQAA